MLVHHFLTQSTERYPEKTALVCGDRYSYLDLETFSNAFASYLTEEGVRKGDRIAVLLENGMPAVVSIMGTLKAGAAFIPIHPTTKVNKLLHILRDSRARVLVTSPGVVADIEGQGGIEKTDVNTVIEVGMARNEKDPGSHPQFEEIIQDRTWDMNSTMNLASETTRVIDLDIAAIIYTSGSMGVPKGVTLTHRNMVSAADSITQYLGNTSRDVIMNALPLSFDYGLYQVLMALKIGGRVILERSFSYPFQVLTQMQEEEVTGFPGIPSIFTVLSRMEKLGGMSFPSLRYMTSTGAVLPVPVLRKMREVFPDVQFYSMYGLTECKRVSYLPPSEIDRRPTSVGRGMPNEDVFVLREDRTETAPGEVGELVVRGSNVMAGYWNDPETTDQVLRPGRYPWEKVLYTGDLFKKDEEGYLYFVSRKDDIIKCREGKVSPREIEDVLMMIPEVLDVAVVGIPDELFGTAPQAHLALVDGRIITEREVKAFCSKHLESFMMPGSVVFHSQIPRNSSGKLDRNALVAFGERRKT